MTILTIFVSIFLLLEFSNVLALYFKPTMKQANAVGMFKAWEKSKKYTEVHDLVQYLVYWVAGTKLIFIALTIVIFIWGSDFLKITATIALILSIASYYWKLHPLIKKMDDNGEVDPKGYSKTLGFMIFSFILSLSVAVLYAYLTR